MEAYKGGLKGYWKRRDYQRLDGSNGSWGRRYRRKNKHQVELGKAGGAGQKRRFWRIKVTPRLVFLRKVISPRRFFARIRDSYVRMMLRFASSGAFGGDYGYNGEDLPGFARPPVKEYDEKMIVEIYKSLMAQGNLLAAAKDAAPTAQIVPPSF